MLTFLYFFLDGMILFSFGYVVGRVRPMKLLGVHFAIEKDKPGAKS